MERINQNDDMGVIPIPSQVEKGDSTNVVTSENDLVLQAQEALLLEKIQ